jgi:hypothetical protein
MYKTIPMSDAELRKAYNKLLKKNIIEMLILNNRIIDWLTRQPRPENFGSIDSGRPL